MVIELFVLAAIILFGILSNIQQLQQKLIAVSYQMLGTVAAAEDIAQETIADFLDKKKKRPSIKNEEAYLVRTAINKSLNQLKKESRSTYIGPWLPEPLLDESLRNESRLDLSFGFALLLDKLNPNERAVFILRESFDFSFAEIAKQLELEAAGARKLFQRAKAKLKQHRPAAKVDVAHQQKLIQAFQIAIAQGDMDSIHALLKEDMILYSDGGGKKLAALKPIIGRARCVKFILGLLEKSLKEGEQIRQELKVVDNELFILQYLYEELDSIIYFDMHQEQIGDIFIQRNPEKYASLVTK